MARSDNQLLQIFLIVFCVLTILLGVVSFVLYKQYSDQRQIAEDDSQKLRDTEGALRKTQTELNEMKQMVGMDENDNAEQSKEIFQQDMETFAAAFPEDKRRYRDALVYLSDSLRDASAHLADVQQELESLKTEFVQHEETKEKQIEQHALAAQQAREDLESQTAKFTSDRARIDSEKEELAQQLQEVRSTLDELEQKTADDNKRFTTEIAQSQSNLRSLTQKYREETRETFEVADGEVVFVDQASSTVWINLGYADELRRQTTFSVYSAEENDVARYESKGSIEVTNASKPHLAEARIMDDELINPILPGDKIFTPAWHPGRKEQFAIAGMFDLDGDDKGDRDIVRNLILRTGSVVDAELDDAGQMTGQMTINTRYLVVGEEPITNEALIAFNKMVREAQNLGIETLTKAKFLDHVGFTPGTRLLNYSKSKPAEFKAPQRDKVRRPVSNGNVSPLFRKRTPPRRGGVTAE